MRISCIDPVIDSESTILILGTIPGEESLLQKKYYANPKNHFWDIVFRILDNNWDFYKIVDDSIKFNDRYKLLFENKIALWDVLHSCEREGSSDRKIKNEISNDFNSFLESNKNIRSIVFNGGNTERFFFKHNKPTLFKNIDFQKVNSTSTLNPNNTFVILNEWKRTINNAC